MAYELDTRHRYLPVEDTALLKEATERFSVPFQEKHPTFRRLNPDNNDKKLFRVTFGKEPIVKGSMIAVVTDGKAA